MSTVRAASKAFKAAQVVRRGVAAVLLRAVNMPQLVVADVSKAHSSRWSL